MKLNIKPGALVVNDACEVAAELRLVYVDFHSKRGEVSCYSSDSDGIPGVHVEPVEGSVKLSETDTGWTEIEFPEMKGWHIIAHNFARYTLTLVFQKDRTS